MRFAAPWDRTLRISTTVAAVLVLAVGIFVLRLGAASEEPLAEAITALAFAAIAAAVGLAWALAPRAFSIEGGRLRVERALFPVEVPLARVRAAGPLPDERFRGSVRVAGSGGFFGYYGRFWSRSLGSFRLYATRRTGLVVVDTADERFVLSPEPAGRFLEVLHQRAASAGSFAEAPLAPRPMPRRARLGMVLLVASIPVVLGGIAFGAWALSPRGVAVAEGEIRVERALAPAVVIALADVRRVERLAPGQARFWRVAGTEIPGGVRYGRFRSRELGDVQLYAWRPGPYVLLETAGGRVVVTPDDADGFVAAVRAALPP